MVVDSMLPHAELGSNDPRKDAPSLESASWIIDSLDNFSSRDFETRFRSPLKFYISETLLGDRDFEKYHWDEKRSEYFIDRHRGTFEVISNWMMRQGPLGTGLIFIRPVIEPWSIVVSHVVIDVK